MSTDFDYFIESKSAYNAYGNQTQKIISVLLKRFISENPATDLIPIKQYPEGQQVATDGSVTIDFETLSSRDRLGSRYTALTYLYADQPQDIFLFISVYGPTQCYLNGELIFTSDAYQENMRMKNNLHLPLAIGKNSLIIVSEKTQMGSGFQIGTTNTRWLPVHFYRNEDSLGFWLFSKEYLPTQSLALSFKEEKIPISEIKTSEKKVFLIKIPVEQIVNEVVYEGKGREVFKICKGNKIQPLNSKREKVSSQSKYLELVYNGKNLSEDLSKIYINNQSIQKWFYCGPLEENVSINSFSWTHLHHGTNEKNIFWHSSEGNQPIRLFSNAPLFGYWNYPMGVSLYGILEAGRFYKDETLLEYVQENISQIVETYEYCLWDRQQYHFLGINSHFYWLQELDDCGSFGSTLLEAAKDNIFSPKIIKSMADKIAIHMSKKQKRESDGAFSRYNDTMWADDLYMSVPFLVRYWQYSGEDSFLDDAARQLLCFKSRLFIKDEKLMSHIFDTRTGVPNMIPWSRGNGWVIFSLSELLNVMPESSNYYLDIKSFYNELVVGILEVQGESGLWHQVLDEEATYLESSATSMFICALARGIRQGYLKEELVKKSLLAINHAWTGLVTRCIDQSGNLYGTCQGSGFSFSKSYYKQLTWRKNDTHGIGITALAGVELMKVNDWLKE